MQVPTRFVFRVFLSTIALTTNVGGLYVVCSRIIIYPVDSFRCLIGRNFSQLRNNIAMAYAHQQYGDRNIYARIPTA